MVIQIITTIFVGLVVLKSFLERLNKKISRPYFIFGILFWGTALVIFWRPEVTQKLANFLQVGRGADAIFYVAIMALFLIVFRIYNQLEKVDRNLTTLVRKIALLDLKDPEEKGK